MIRDWICVMVMRGQKDGSGGETAWCHRRRTRVQRGMSWRWMSRESRTRWQLLLWMLETRNSFIFVIGHECPWRLMSGGERRW
jgi:hypothetical protein